MKVRSRHNPVTPLLWLTAVLLWCAAAPLYADPVKLTNESAVKNLGYQIDLMEDSHGSLSIDQVKSGDLDYQWIGSDVSTPNFGYTDSTFWYRVTFVNDTGDKARRILAVAYPLLDVVDFYLVNEQNQVIKTVNTGDTRPLSSREFEHRDFLFELNIPAGAEQTVFLRVYTAGAQQLPLELWSEREFFLQDQAILITKASYFGVMGIMVLFNLFIYFSLREKSYLYYIGFIFCFVMTQAAMTGFAQQFIWPDKPHLNQVSVLFFVPATMVFAALFSMEFLSLKNRLPLFNRFLRVTVVVNCISCALSTVLPYSISTRFSVALVFPTSLALLAIGPILWARGVKDARFYTVAWFTLVLGTAIVSLNKFGLIPRNVITENGLVIGSALEALLLSLALADRFNREREQRYIAQKEKFEEASERQRIEEQMMYQSLHSPVTHLPNRVMLSCKIDEIIQRYDENEFSFAVVLIHLKRFHEINKTLGHQNADELLKLISERLSRQARELTQIISLNNSEGGAEHVANVEGVTFAILVRAINRDAAQMSIETLSRQVTEPVDYKGMSLDVGASSGVAFYPEHGETSGSLLRHAHIAIDMAERNENQIAIYSKDMNPYSARRLTLMGELRKAIDENGLELFYQPQVNLFDNSIHGVEALIRWNHPVHGFIPPDEFIPMAEQTGIIKSLTQWVINRALAFATELHEQGLKLSVSVNISAMNLQEKRFDLSVRELLNRYHLPPEYLMLEVTETSVMQDTARCFNMLKRLHELGIQLSVDDFGTGHSSLSYIKKLPVQEIKIDRSFVMDMDKNADDEVIVKTTINMCHSLNYKVVAEGVESFEICASLKRMGCDYIQGYYISRPLSQKDLQQWLSDESWQPLLNVS
ncbi:MAG: EAL domain-containing protein [Ketobacteraceae bacterium]|nr:EAL domain-containing protein [Ketobacteraceae bacterium]